MGVGGCQTGCLQLCCSVLDSMGGAESYRVSVSCVGSPASVHGLDSVPAPQSQKNLQGPESRADKRRGGKGGVAYGRRGPASYRSCRINSTSWPWWHFLMQLTQMAFLSVVLQV